MRHLSFVVAMCVCSVGLFSAPASAQLAPGYSGHSSQDIEGTEKDYWYIIRYMGDCLSGAKDQKMREMLATKPGSRAEDRVFKNLFNRSYNACMQNFVHVRFIRAHLRGSVAEGLYRRNIKALGEGWKPVISEPEGIITLHDFAQCYIASNFDQVKSLLANTKLASDAEHEALSTLAPGFGSCLPSEREVKIRPTSLRLALAEAMYHATNAQAAREGE